MNMNMPESRQQDLCLTDPVRLQTALAVIRASSDFERQPPDADQRRIFRQGPTTDADSAAITDDSVHRIHRWALPPSLAVPGAH